MKHLPVSGLLAFGILLGCTERYSGGFETSDLQARVVRPTGSPVAAARVWLVKATNDSMPATALDSTLTDSTGTARFTVVRGVDRKGLGLDAQIGDSLGISIRSLEQSDLATIQVVPAFRLQVGGDSIPVDTLHSIGLHIPGSHFASSSAGGTASLLVPQGTWDIAIRQGSSIEFKDSLAITKDSALPLVAPLDTTKPADTTQHSVDTLLAGPDIALDSFKFDGRRWDNGISGKWIPYNYTGCDSSTGTCEVFTSRVDFVGSNRMDSLKFQVRDSTILDSLRYTGWSEARLSLLGDTGMLAIEFDGSSVPFYDSMMSLTIALQDSESGLAIRFNAQQRSGIRTSGIFGSGGGIDTLIDSSNSVDIQLAQHWYLVWYIDHFVVVNNRGQSWSVPRSGLSRSPQASIRLDALSDWKTQSLTIRRTRIYN